jgi:ABC-type Na+ efflux pump permease subunit
MLLDFAVVVLLWYFIGGIVLMLRADLVETSEPNKYVTHDVMLFAAMLTLWPMMQRAVGLVDKLYCEESSCSKL